MITTSFRSCICFARSRDFVTKHAQTPSRRQERQKVSTQHRYTREAFLCHAEAEEEQSVVNKPEGGNKQERPSLSEEQAEPPRADDVLPDSLGDSLLQAGKATYQAIENGVSRCLVEILLPEFWDSSSGAVFAEEGDQQRFWKLTKRFVDSLAEADPQCTIRIVYPDVGVAAMLQNSWKDTPFRISSLTDRRPLEESDDLIVLAAPDPQGLDACKTIAADLEEDQRPLVLFNPRLASGDVGVGLNVRRMRSRFLSTFTTTYCLRPVGDIGSVFRCYPSLWQVFVEDSSSPGRFNLIAEKPSRPAGEALDDIVMDYYGRPQGDGDGSPPPKPSLFGQLQSTVQSLQRFAKQLSQ